MLNTANRYQALVGSEQEVASLLPQNSAKVSAIVNVITWVSELQIKKFAHFKTLPGDKEVLLCKPQVSRLFQYSQGTISVQDKMDWFLQLPWKNFFVGKLSLCLTLEFNNGGVKEEFTFAFPITREVEAELFTCSHLVMNQIDQPAQVLSISKRNS